MSEQAQKIYSIVAPRGGEGDLIGGRRVEAWVSFCCTLLFVLIGLGATVFFAVSAMNVAQNGPAELGATMLMDLAPPILILAALWAFAVKTAVLTLISLALTMVIFLSGELRARGTDQ